jgi:hypothetical protein
MEQTTGRYRTGNNDDDNYNDDDDLVEHLSSEEFNQGTLSDNEPLTAGSRDTMKGSALCRSRTNQ